jgi:glycosyltransferase involved in cell wall biosynthesis
VNLLIVHYHLRPGGVRRIIELGTPPLLKRMPEIKRVVLLVGEAGDWNWNIQLQRSLRPVPCDIQVERTLGYTAELNHLTPDFIRARIRKSLEALVVGSEPWAVWAHNLGVGRNLVLASELQAFCREHNFSMLSHHHDWWFDNRWQRLKEFGPSGFDSLETAAEAILPVGPNIHHGAINKEAARFLKHRMGTRAHWIPNLTSVPEPASKKELFKTREWLASRLRPLGRKSSKSPVWILPCRLLRRKNIAEAIFLTRLIDPNAWLITTGGASSESEKPYAAKLERAILAGRWKVKLGILSQAIDTEPPGVPELMTVSDATIVSSIQEGFGLPYLEATASGSPLIARAIPEISGDLTTMGFRFPQLYNEIQIPKALFDWTAEAQRQQELFDQWVQQLPPNLQKEARESRTSAPWLSKDEIPFSRLTLTAQLEILSRPIDSSWEACRPLNPFLETWRSRITKKGHLDQAPWPKKADRFIGSRQYGSKLAEIFSTKSSPKKIRAPISATEAQRRFMQAKLGPESMFPLMWAEET